MGGIAFNKPKSPYNLNTPRMPPDVYRRVRDRCHTLLRRRFLAVASPIEAPCKQDYGDVDIFVAWDTLAHIDAACGDDGEGPDPDEAGADAGLPVIVEYEDGLRLLPDLGWGPGVAAGSHPSPFSRSMLRSVGELLGAKYFKLDGLVDLDAQYAIPWPENDEDAEADDQQATTETRYIQIDLHVYKTIDDFNWALFTYTHGDMRSILQNMLRPFNLDMNRQGFYLRTPELGEHQKVLITREPGHFLRFLGYNPTSKEWERELKSVAALFELAAQCRFFAGFAGTELTEEDVLAIQFREIFRTWVRDAVPTYDSEKCTGYQLGPVAVRQEVFNAFPNARVEYETQCLQYHEANQQDLYHRVIQPAMPASNEIEGSIAWRHVAETALREIIMEDDYDLGIKPVTPLKSPDGLYIVEEVKRFVSEMWREVGSTAWLRQYGPNGRQQQRLGRQAAGGRAKASLKQLRYIAW